MKMDELRTMPDASASGQAMRFGGDLPGPYWPFPPWPLPWPGPWLFAGLSGGDVHGLFVSTFLKRRQDSQGKDTMRATLDELNATGLLKSDEAAALGKAVDLFANTEDTRALLGGLRAIQGDLVKSSRAGSIGVLIMSIAIDSVGNQLGQSGPMQRSV